MGMFDSVMITCPSCGKKLEFQSKAGDCTLATYEQDKVPIEIAYDIGLDVERCECGAYVGVMRDTEIRTVPVIGVICKY